MAGYLNPQEVEAMRAGWKVLFDTLLRAPAATPDTAPDPPREPHPEITMAQRLAVWDSDPERAREIRAIQVVEWGEDSVRVDEEDHILYPYPSASAGDKPRNVAS